MSELIRIDNWDDIDKSFEGIMIDVEDIVGKYFVPGWKCKVCGWKVGTKRLPPSHTCPDDGEKQKQRRLTS